jgi:hypothetical protein
MLRQLQSDLWKRGVRLVFARVDASLHTDFVRHRLIEVIGQEFIFSRIHDALNAFAQMRTSATQTHSPGKEQAIPLPEQ